MACSSGPWSRSRWLAAALLSLSCTSSPSTPGGSGATGDTEPGTTTADSSTTNSPGSSGGFDDTNFGMDDDMPLVTSIPEIKQGNVVVGTAVSLSNVVSTTPALVGDYATGSMVQDPTAETYAGLHLRMPASVGTPEQGIRLSIVGEVASDPEWGLVVLGYSFTPGGATTPPPLVTTTTDRVGPGGSLRRELADMVIQLVGPTGEGMRVVSSTAGTQSFVLDDDLEVQLAPFGVDAPIPAPDDVMMEVTGVLVLDGARSLLWPTTPDDLVPAG